MTPPLTGRRVLVTRRRSQSAEMTDQLRALGAEVVEIPAIEIAAPEDATAFDAAMRALSTYDWVVFTSPNGVERTRLRADAIRGAAEAMACVRVAVVGPSTDKALAKHFGRVADLVPAADFRAEGLVAAFERESVEDRRVLTLVAEKARDLLPRSLRARGAQVDEVAAYRTVAPPGLDEELRRVLARGVDLALFASPSAIENLASAVGERVRGLPCVVIGPSTEAAARQWALDVRGVASPSTSEGLVAAAQAALSDPPAVRHPKPNAS